MTSSRAQAFIFGLFRSSTSSRLVKSAEQQEKYAVVTKQMIVPVIHSTEVVSISEVQFIHESNGSISPNSTAFRTTFTYVPTPEESRNWLEIIVSQNTQSLGMFLKNRQGTSFEYETKVYEESSDREGSSSMRWKISLEGTTFVLSSEMNYFFIPASVADQVYQAGSKAGSKKSDTKLKFKTQ